MYFDVDLLLLVGRDGGPAGLGPVAVVIPLEKGDVVLGEQLVEEAEDVLAHIGAGEVEDELIAAFGARAAGEVEHPVGMLAVEIAVRD